jgi:hypothetical protein
VTLDIFQESEVLMFLAWSAFTVTIALLGMLWTQLVDPVAGKLSASKDQFEFRLTY